MEKRQITNLLKTRPKSFLKVSADWLGAVNNDFFVETVEKGGVFSKFFIRLHGIIQGTVHDNTPATLTIMRDGSVNLVPAA